MAALESPPECERLVVVLSVHPTSVAATRLRAQQYSGALAAAGIRLHSWSFLREDDLLAWYGKSQLRRAWTAMKGIARLPRIVQPLRRATVVMVQREALPFGPPFIELLAARLAPMVWDLDDALWETYMSPTAGRVPRWFRATGDKYRWICRSADEVWAGSEVLASWCRVCNPNVTVIPTVVPVPETLPVPTSDRRVGWIGSHSTGSFIEAILPAMSSLSPPLEVTVVGAAPRVPPGLDVTVRRWSERAEIEALAETRVGLYPIDVAHPLAEGKCGLKAILYMANGIPCVVTPTTTNAAVVRDGVDGLHARTPDEWTAAVKLLLEDVDLWQRCREAAHARAREHYSLEAWAPRVVDRLLSLAARRAN